MFFIVLCSISHRPSLFVEGVFVVDLPPPPPGEGGVDLSCLFPSLFIAAAWGHVRCPLSLVVLGVEVFPQNSGCAPTSLVEEQFYDPLSFLECK